MKVIKYNLRTMVNWGSELEPDWREMLTAVEMGWNEANEEIAKREAYNGEYTIEDDDVEEKSAPTQEERIKELEEALALLLSGATE